MASFFSHPAAPVGLALLGFKSTKRLMLLCVLLTLLPDADVVAFKFGIPYESQWGHRGFTHSISFALFVGLVCTFFHGRLGTSRFSAFVWTFLSTLSHALLDALTNGGLGVALFWPVNHERYFFPFRPVQVSPIGAGAFFSWRGLQVLVSEITWIWLPLTGLSCLIRYFRLRKN